MNRKLRIGIVGAGRNTQERHIPGLVGEDDVEVVAVCNRSEESSRRVAEKFHISKTHSTWKHLINDDEVDAVVIGTWPYLHCPVTVAALEAGKHVLCEARMAMNAVEAEQMLLALRANPSLVGQIVPSPMTLDVDATVARLLAERALGTVFAAEVVIRSGTFPDPAEPLGWRQNEDLSGRNIMSLGIWYEALMRWIGPATSVAALGRTVVPLRPATGELGPVRATRIPDHLSVLCEMACGAQVNMLFSTVAGGFPESSITLYGDGGTLRFSGGQLSLIRRGREGTQLVEPKAAERRGWQVEADFIASIRDGAPVRLTSFEEGLRYMKFTDAVWKSLVEQRAVPVSP